MKETGLCENRRAVSREAIHALVLKGIEENLTAPEIIAEYDREYHRMSRELHGSTAHRHPDLGKRLGNVNGAIAKAVDVPASRNAKPRPAERDEICGGNRRRRPARIRIPPERRERLLPSGYEPGG
jgi:hypothetical protein